MKRKIIWKTLSYVLAAAIVFGSMPVPVMATESENQSEPPVVEITEMDTETVSENNSGETEYPLASKLDLFGLDWRKESNETINYYLGMTEWSVIGMWLDSLSEEDLNELLSRDTVLTQPSYVQEADGDQFEMLYHEYASKVYNEEKGVLYASYPKKTSGFFTTKIVKLNGSGTAVNTATITHKISGIDTSLTTEEKQTITVTRTIANNWCGIQADATEETRTYAGSENGSQRYVKSPFTYTKPAGYTVSTEYSHNTGVHEIYWNHSKVFGSGLMFPDGVFNTDRHPYPSSVTCNNVSTASLLASTYSGTHYIGPVINYLTLAGVGTTTTEALGNLEQTIYLTPVKYNVNYSGNGNTSGSTSAQNCTYDQTYTIQQNGYSRDYTVTYDGNGGTPAVSSQEANYKFKGWGLNQTTKIDYAAGASFKNLTAAKDGKVTLYALWNTASVKLPTAAREGYQFTGWNIGKAGTSYTPTKDTTAKANWTANTYKILLKANGGTLETNKADVTLNATYDKEISLPTPERAGYTFEGWVGEVGTYKDTAKNLTSVNNETVTLTASWTANTGTPYTVYRYKQLNENIPLDVNDSSTYKKFEEGDPVLGMETFYGTTDSVITVPAESVDGYITPDAQIVTIAGDGSTVVNFFYKLVPTEKDIQYQVKHFIKTSPDGEYKLFKTETLSAKEDTVIAPPLNQDAIKAVNAVEGCYCVSPQIQSMTIKEDLIISYYYDCVKKAVEKDDKDDSLTDEELDEIAKKLAAGLSFSLDIDGATYEIVQNPDGTLGIKFSTTNDTKVVIPDVVKIGDKVYRITEIHEKAFQNNTNLKEVVLSANIQKIGDYAFKGCKNLEKVSMHEGLVNIGNHAFDGCTSLKSVKTPSTLQTIGSYAFQNCTSLKKVTLNTGLLKIGTKAFYNCKALASIKFPKTLLKIGKYAFAKCVKLKKVTFAYDSQLLTMNTGVFAYCKSLTKITLPSHLRMVPTKGFYNCTKLKYVTIGKRVTKIGKYAFQNCKKISKITIPATVQKIGTKAFYNCKALKKVTIKSKAVTIVGSKAFKKCKKGLKFAVPKSKKKAYQKLFKGKY